MTTTALAEQITRIVDSAAAKLELGPSWKQAAADTILRLPEIQNLFAEHATVEVLRARHVQRPMVDGSTWSECAGCRMPFPCPDAIALGVEG